MSEVQWVRHTWDLASVSLQPLRHADCVVRDALPEERSDVIGTCIEAYASDPVWQDELPTIALRMTRRIASTFDDPGARYLVAVRDGSIAGVSGIAARHATGQNLLTGLCVRRQFQRQGIGTELLLRSLMALRHLGVSRAVVFTEAGSIADRKLYVLYGSTRRTGVEYPGATELPRIPVVDVDSIQRNSYFGGAVQSLGYTSRHGRRTVGIITPGAYEFTTMCSERVTILDSYLKVSIPGVGERLTYRGDSYDVPAATRFEVTATSPVAYHCIFNP